MRGGPPPQRACTKNDFLKESHAADIDAVHNLCTYEPWLTRAQALTEIVTDEYHVPVPLPDIWAEYKRLVEEEKWVHQKIADAKGVNRATVTLRLSWACFPTKVREAFVKNDFLKESHAAELDALLKFNNLAPWLTREQARPEIVAAVLDTHRGGSAGPARMSAC